MLNRVRLSMEDFIMQNSATSTSVGGKRLISSREVEGVTVYGADGEKVGCIIIW